MWNVYYFFHNKYIIFNLFIFHEFSYAYDIIRSKYIQYYLVLPSEFPKSEHESPFYRNIMGRGQLLQPIICVTQKVCYHFFNTKYANFLTYYNFVIFTEYKWVYTSLVVTKHAETWDKAKFDVCTNVQCKLLFTITIALYFSLFFPYKKSNDTFYIRFI